jgi:hypothetical protein
VTQKRNREGGELNLSKRGKRRGTHTHHHLNITIEGEEGNTSSTSRS